MQYEPTGSARASPSLLKIFTTAVLQSLRTTSSLFTALAPAVLGPFSIPRSFSSLEIKVPCTFIVYNRHRHSEKLMVPMLSLSPHPRFFGKLINVKAMKGLRQLCIKRLHSSILSSYTQTTQNVLKRSNLKQFSLPVHSLFCKDVLTLLPFSLPFAVTHRKYTPPMRSPAHSNAERTSCTTQMLVPSPLSLSF